MKRVIPLFALFLIATLAEAVPPPRLIKEPAPVPQIAMGKVLNGRIIIPPNGRPGAVKIPSATARRKITEEHLLTRSGGMFHGTFQGFEPDKGIKWSHPDFLPKVIEFLPDRVSRLNFKIAPLPPRAKAHTSKIELTNNDIVVGDIVRMEDEKLFLNTWYAGELAINTAYIKSIKPGHSTAEVYFDGPKKAENWTFNNGQNSGFPLRMIPNLPPEQQEQLKKRAELAAKGPTWKFANGTFESTSSNSMVGRDMKKTPKRSSTEFDVEWTGSMNLYINFRTDSLRSYSMCNGYSLRLTQSYVYLYRYNFNNGAGRGGRLGSNVQITNLRDNARVAIKVDETKKTLALIINDVLVQKWENVGDIPDGKGLLFTSRTTNRMKLSRIRVTEWNGTLPEADLKPKATPKADYISLGNSDHLTGTVTRIADGKLHFNSELGEMKIDLQRVASIHRATESYQPIPLMKESARANFKGGGGMSFKITGWKNNQVTATSPIFGEAVFDPIIFQSIDFTGNTTAQTSTRSTSSSNNTVRIEPGFAIPQQLKRQALPAPRRIPNAQFELEVIPRRPVAPQKAPRP